jgi:hypothetical protein
MPADACRAQKWRPARFSRASRNERLSFRNTETLIVPSQHRTVSIRLSWECGIHSVEVKYTDGIFAPYRQR